MTQPGGALLGALGQEGSFVLPIREEAAPLDPLALGVGVGGSHRGNNSTKRRVAAKQPCPFPLPQASRAGAANFSGAKIKQGAWERRPKKPTTLQCSGGFRAPEVWRSVSKVKSESPRCGRSSPDAGPTRGEAEAESLALLRPSKRSGLGPWPAAGHAQTAGRKGR